MTKKRYRIQYEAFDDPEWTTETYTITADVVECMGRIVRFKNTDTTEEFIVPTDNMIAAWTSYE